MDGERLTLTVDEAAKLLGIGRQLAYDRVKTGEIPAIKMGRRLLVPRRALEKLLDGPQRPGTADSNASRGGAAR
ncbi:MAG: helix-turn-helix domain-containing protein [Dehalococcoidia bacterium]|nr:helix-turn-helix domain-containing protein [Dehalococcoidia bacterium]